MGTGNALRATETFTLIQLEEERQKLKKKELLKSMLTDSEFSSDMLPPLKSLILKWGLLAQWLY